MTPKKSLNGYCLTTHQIEASLYWKCEYNNSQGPENKHTVSHAKIYNVSTIWMSLSPIPVLEEPTACLLLRLQPSWQCTEMTRLVFHQGIQGGEWMQYSVCRAEISDWPLESRQSSKKWLQIPIRGFFYLEAIFCGAPFLCYRFHERDKILHNKVLLRFWETKLL